MPPRRPQLEFGHALIRSSCGMTQQCSAVWDRKWKIPHPLETARKIYSAYYHGFTVVKEWQLGSPITTESGGGIGCCGVCFLLSSGEECHRPPRCPTGRPLRQSLRMSLQGGHHILRRCACSAVRGFSAHRGEVTKMLSEQLCRIRGFPSYLEVDSELVSSHLTVWLATKYTHRQKIPFVWG